MASQHTVEYTWTSTETSKRTVADGGSVNGYFTITDNNGVSSYPFNKTITDIKVRLGTCSVVASGGAYLRFGDNLQTVDLSYSSYSSYTTHDNVDAYCSKEVLTWLQDCATRGTLVRMAPHAVSSAQVQSNVVQVAPRMTVTVSITYIDSYNMDYVFAPGDTPSSATAGESFDVDLYAGSDRELLNYVVELNLFLGSQVVRTTQQTYNWSNTSFATNKQFSFTVPTEWSGVYPDVASVSNAIGVRGYAYDSRTIFKQQSVNDHGFGFADIEPVALVSDVRDKVISFSTGNTANKPVLNSFELTSLIKYYSGTTAPIIATQYYAPSSPRTGDLWLDQSQSIPLLREYTGSSWGWHPFLKEYHGVSLRLTSTMKNNASLDRYYIHLFKKNPLHNGNANKLVTEMQSALDGVSKSSWFDDYETLGIYQSLDGEYTINILPDSGTLYILAYAADTRGMYTSPSCITIEVQEYTLPDLTAQAYRVKQNQDIADSDGPRIKCVLTGTRSSIPCPVSGFSPWNTANIQCSITGFGTVWTQSYTSDSSLIDRSGIASKANGFTDQATWQVIFSYTDKIVSNSRVVSIAPYSYTLHFMRGGTGIGIGRVCSQTASIEIDKNWKVCLDTVPLIQFVGANDNAPAGVKGCIYLRALS